MTDEVEAMARAFVNIVRGHVKQPPIATLNEATQDERATALLFVNAAIRACHAAGGLVLREVPGETIRPESVPWRYGDSWNEIQDSADDETLEAICSGYADGHNAAVAKVRAAAVEGV